MATAKHNCTQNQPRPVEIPYPPMTLQQALENYRHCIRYERNLAKTTVFGNTSMIRGYIRWLQENGYPEPPIACLDPTVVRRYIARLTEDGLRPRSVRGRIYPLRALCDHLVEENVVSENPLVGLRLPKKDAARRDVPREDEISQVLQGVERLPNPRQMAMARALVKTLVYAGLRRAELLALHVSDFNAEDGTILVRSGKGSKSRKVPICRDGQVSISEWLAVRPPAQHNSMWLVDRARPLGQEGLRRLLEAVKAVSGLRGCKALQPHSLRHAAATRLLRNGVDLRTIQNFLGHSSLVTTSVYLHSGEEDLLRIAECQTLRPSQANESGRKNPDPGTPRSRRYNRYPTRG